MYEGQYSLIGIEFSFFTRKLEAQLLYQGIPFKWQFKTLESTKEVETRAGTRFIPVLETPDGWMIHDTIAIGPMLHDRFHETPVIPEDAPCGRCVSFWKTTSTIGSPGMYCIPAGATSTASPMPAGALA